ncbi:MAG: response regulator, partial [Candidatus Electrothrix sp.]
NNGKEAVEAVSARDFDAVLMDIQMPVMDGYEATKAIRQDLGKTDLPILAMTAHAVSEERDKCFQIGMNDHIAKPINRNTLFLALSNWIGETAERQSEKQAADIDLLAVAPQESQRSHRNHVSDPLRQLLAEAERGDAPTGIDFAEGLQRVEGNEKLYLKLLRSFCREQKEALETIPGLLKKDNREEARYFAHGLKGVAGNIGMSDLQKLSSRAEQKAGYGTVEDFQEVFQKLIQELNQIIAYLAPRVGTPAKQEKQEKQMGDTAKTTNEQDRHKALLLLRRLAVLLEQSDFSSLQFLEGNQGTVRALLDESSLSRLTGYIEGFHFKNALNLINKIIAGQS